MKKRICSALLALALTLVVLLPTAQAVGSSIVEQGIREISKTQYNVAPGVTEYEWLLNNSSLTEQMVGHVMEVKVGSGSTASIAVGYGDDNIQSIASGRNWAMTETTKQAQSMQTRRDINVVGAINAGGYDMSNGRPSGAFIMSGTQINAPTGTTFWIDKDGNAHITSAQECNAAFAAGNVVEAVASFGDIFENGHARSGLDDITRASRTAIGIKADGTVVMLMVDGRQAPYSVGMTMAEVAAAMEELGCVQAVNLDGGGSSTFATQREGEPENSTSAGLTLRCRPSDGYERKVSNTVMVLSTAKPTGQFDHAVLTPNDEVYTPGSTVQFTATGVDAAGGKAEIPAGASWEVLSGNGRIDANGLYTAAGTCGEVEVGLKAGGNTLGQTTIQVQWPDKLGFTNTSVSIDFGQTSDLTFKPTWEGREVHYKDGDFAWSLAPTYYKFSPIVDPKSSNGTADYKMAVTSDSLNKDMKVNGKIYHVSSLEVLPDSDGTQRVNATIQQGESSTVHVAILGKFIGNRFIADNDTSLRATVQTTLTKQPDITGHVDVVVGMEPYVIMDFEDHIAGGETASAANYWSCHVGPSSGEGKNSYLTPDEVRADRIWIRDTSSKGVRFLDDGNQVVSADEDENVRFGQYAFKIGFDFGGERNLTQAMSADFGFSGDMLLNTLQPTKLGLWINVPTDFGGDGTQLKAILKGGASTESGTLTPTAHMAINEDGSTSYFDGQLVGTTSYFQYKSYNADGTVSGSTLSDWAGKGWTWVEADISTLQMPVDMCRAYAIRITSPQNCKKGSGYIYIDNFQFIYGTNTNDVTRPVLESVTETTSGAVLQSDGSTVLGSGNLSFSAVYSDSELTDKYATGIDTSGIRVLLDGADYTSKLEINDGSLYLKGVNLRNGTHTLTIRLKDFYGNVTTETRAFRVENTEGVRSAVDIVPQPEAPEIDKEYVFAIVNNTGETVTKAELTVDFSAMGNAAKYLTGAKVESLGNYNLTLDQNALAKGLAKITVTKRTAQARRAMLTSAQDTDYNYVSELGYLIIKIPENAASDSELRCTVTQGSYTVVDSSGTETAYTFSGEEKAIPLKADYQLNCKQAIAGMPTELTVTDANGATVSRADIYRVDSDGTSTKLGSTNMKGTLKHTFENAGEYTFYAVKTGGGRSWNQRVIVCEKTAENSGKPFGILTNGVTVPGTKSITWLTQIDGSAAKAQVKYSTSNDLSETTVVDGTSALQTFVQSSHGDALRSNQVTLTGLTPGITYYYQVGDGATWSDKQSFKTPAANAEATNFFILGDIQSSDTSNLAHVLDVLKTSETAYDFALQTGDAIDNVTEYVKNWRPFLTTVNSDKLNGVDLIHVLGNHEYYGDAEGKISGAIYDLPASTQNSWYKMEYGKVCVVVVNNGTKLSAALADIAENLTTDCVWKVLVAHEPIYGTEAVSATPEILASIEKAGFDFVFGGDDHAYARTYPMIGGEKQAENSRNGVVYFVCGDLSGKSNEFHNRDEYVKAIPHNDYGGMYLTVNATERSFTVSAIDVNGKELDTYTETRTDCELGRHKVDGTSSKYDMANGTITCAVCGVALEPKNDYAFTGLLSTTDGKQAVLTNGTLKTNEFTSLGEKIYHSCESGYAYETVHTDERTCVTGGRTIDTCPECGAKDQSQFLYPEGHDWNDVYVCSKCGFHGIDIASNAVIFKFNTPEKPRDLTPIPQYAYKSGGIRPSSFGRDGDHILTSSNDAGVGSDGIMKDLYVQWPNNKEIGVAKIVYEGKGNYYGRVELTYVIVPDRVEKLSVTDITGTTAKLTWPAAPGATYYEVYSCNVSGDAKTKVGTSDNCEFVLTGLEPNKTTYYVVKGFAKVNDTSYSHPQYSPVCTVSALPLSADVTAMAATVDDVHIPAVQVDGTNYLFLPASANLASLNAVFTRSAETGDLVVTGDLSSQNVSGTDPLDVSALASETDGYRTITAKVGNGTAFTVRVMQATKLPTVYLTSTDAGTQGRSYVDSSKQNTTTAALRMIDANGGEIAATNITELKARGNSTFTYAEKKSYQIKLDTASNLLQTGENVKTWVLLANYFDATLMHDKLFKDMAASLQMPYTASCDWVSLYYDGEYRGVYLLSEKNTVKSTGVAITDMEDAYKEQNPSYGTDMQTSSGKNAYGMTYFFTKDLKEPENITGGYLLELNHDQPDEVSGFITRQGKGMNVKSPEWCGEEAMRYISEYYQAFEDAVYATDETGAYTGYNESTGKHYYDYVDRDSLVKIFLMQELALNPDGFVSSLYFYKDAGDIMYAGPIWDQDMTLGTGWTKQISPETTDYHYLAQALIQIPDFRAAVLRCYTETFAPLAKKLLAENGVVNDYAARLTDSAAMNFVLWDYIRVGEPSNTGHFWPGATYASVLADMRSWLTNRIAYLDSAFAGTVFEIGDVNMDGVVDTSDAVLILRHSLGYEDEDFNILYADLNGDGSVDSSDAVLALRRALGYTD